MKKLQSTLPNMVMSLGLITLIAGARPNFMKFVPLFKAIQADESRRTQGPLYRPTRTNAPRQDRLRKIPHLVHRKLSPIRQRNKRKARRYIVLGTIQITPHTQ